MDYMAVIIILTIGYMVLAFFRHIIGADCAFTALMVGVLVPYYNKGMHPAFAVLIGLGVFFLLYSLAKFTHVGFWILGVIGSAFLTYMAVDTIVASFSHNDLTWEIVMGIVFFIGFMALHVVDGPSEDIE